MKKIMYFALAALSLSLTINACKKKDKETTPANISPTAVVTFPPNNWNGIASGDSTIILAADAADTNGTVAKVEFYVNEVKVGEDASSPYTAPCLYETEKPYYIKVKATDDQGAYTISSVNYSILHQE